MVKRKDIFGEPYIFEIVEDDKCYRLIDTSTAEVREIHGTYKYCIKRFKKIIKNK